MSLDSVDLLVTVEKYFGISISDSEAEQIITVQNFVDAVLAKVHFNPTDRCKSQVLFYKLRKYFVEKRGFGVQQIRPDTLISTVIPGDPRPVWSEIETYLGLKLPPFSVKLLGITVHKSKISLSQSTLGDMTHWLLAKNYEVLLDAKQLFNKEDVENIIKGIFENRVGVYVEDIKLSDRIVADLGVD